MTRESGLPFMAHVVMNPARRLCALYLVASSPTDAATRFTKSSTVRAHRPRFAQTRPRRVLRNTGPVLTLDRSNQFFNAVTGHVSG